MLAAAFELLLLRNCRRLSFPEGNGTIERQVKSFGSSFSDLEFSIITKKELR
jgi:hypothetical protein